MLALTWALLRYSGLAMEGLLLALVVGEILNVTQFVLPLVAYCWPVAMQALLLSIVLVLVSVVHESCR
jgi:hypothetical protein